MFMEKIMFNGIVSTKGARFVKMDISNVHPMTPLSRPEYTRVKLSNILDKITIDYTLRNKAEKDGSVYIIANCGMYGVPQAVLLAKQLLEQTQQTWLPTKQSCFGPVEA
jgi:hypothetical protein